ncbi:MAG: hypothetical protein Q7T80_00605 [Methanoregula sp.]|nr:hypothetical protein [Methanoregula sp.]
MGSCPFYEISFVVPVLEFRAGGGSFTERANRFLILRFGGAGPGEVGAGMLRSKVALAHRQQGLSPVGPKDAVKKRMKSHDFTPGRLKMLHSTRNFNFFDLSSGVFKILKTNG